MIKIFRQIRHNLINTGKTGKYLKYAIGEIFLVVIGILIALQVNTWNEQRKHRNSTQKLLLEYKAELNYNHNSLDFAQKRMKRSERSCETILKHIEENLPYTDSLSYDFRVLSASLGKSYLSTSAFKAIENMGFDIIKNDSLKNKITQLHTFQYERLNDRIENQMSNVVAYGRPIIRHKLKAMGNGIFVPLHYEELMNEISLWNTLKTLKGNYSNLYDLILGVQSEINEIEDLIDQFSVGKL